MKDLDGFELYNFFKAGFFRIHAARKYIDTINVFPVPDGDTGTNLCFTLSGAIDATVPASSASTTLASLADAALLSARGNSGVIFAQFLSGLSEAVESTELRVHEFAASVQKAHLRAREAVSDPQDGTILSVIEAWAIALSRLSPHSSSITELIGASRDDLKRSLFETRGKLAALRAAGVVDAGAAGFVEFVEGGHDYLVNGMAAAERPPSEAMVSLGHSHESAPAEAPVLRYCIEAIITAEAIDHEKVKAAIGDLGDCLIVAGGKTRIKIHIHSDQPSLVMDRLSAFGAVTGQKADDMYLQYTDAHQRNAAVAIVTDSSCDLPPALLDAHRIHVVPLMLLAGGNEYLDKLTMNAEQLRHHSENSASFPRSSQPPAPFFSRLYANLSDYYEGILAIHLSSVMSGTYAASAREAEKYGSLVSAYDSRHLSGSLGLIVLRAARAAEAGGSREEILALLPEWSAKARILVSVSSLRYMVKGGRVSPLKGFLASALNLKPIVSVDATGKSILYGKAFSEKANLRKIKRMVLEDMAKRPLKYYAIGHSGAPEKAEAFAWELEEAIGFPPLYVEEISAVVALNSGPGAVSVVTMAE